MMGGNMRIEWYKTWKWGRVISETTGRYIDCFGFFAIYYD